MGRLSSFAAAAARRLPRAVSAHAVRSRVLRVPSARAAAVPSLQRSMVSPAKLNESFVTGNGGAYMEDLHEMWQQDPESVHVSWRAFFENLEQGDSEGDANVLPPSLHGAGGLATSEVIDFFIGVYSSSYESTSAVLACLRACVRACLLACWLAGLISLSLARSLARSRARALSLPSPSLPSFSFSPSLPPSTGLPPPRPSQDSNPAAVAARDHMKLLLLVRAYQVLSATMRN